jgi:hypothetical protein
MIERFLSGAGKAYLPTVLGPAALEKDEELFSSIPPNQIARPDATG